MLRKLFTNAMACLITLHAVLGCCWHHAHGDERAASGGIAVAAHAECDHCHPGDDHASPEKPQKCRTECGSVCTFLPSQKIHFEAPLMTVALDWVIVAEAVPPATTFATIAFSRQRSEPPLRLHLLHQLLLI